MKIPGVGPAFATRLEKLGIFTEEDLLYHIPSRYEDFSIISSISQIQPGEVVTVKGVVLEIKNIFTPSGFVLQKAKIKDDTGVLDVVWFNQRFLTKAIHKNDGISLSGKIDDKKQMVAPQFEVGSSIHTGRFVPIYPETEGISSKWLRAKIYYLLENLKVDDYLPRGEFMELGLALQKVHFPDSLEQAAQAKYRLAFDELLKAQVESQIRKSQWQKKLVGNKFEKIVTDLKLPFELTTAQKRVIAEISADLQKNVPMNRLLQGDVGSGKTVVAAIAMKSASLNGYQSALMAPTEILANQHFETLKKLGLNVGLSTSANKIDLTADILVGTHALLDSQINFKNLGLVIIDEQHRFGVEQRAKLTSKGVNPHVLTMTATPIPRTIALTLYGDLDLSVIDEMPKDRLPVKTWVVPNTKRAKAYEWIAKQNTQCFIICPFIEESETATSVKAATTEFDRLKSILPLKLGLLHGRMKNKDKILTAFKNKEFDVLVTTPVVEVGIDIPNATIMIIEDADRFGLAQLHQLRGRVGRGAQQSYCFLFSEGNIGRLKFLEKVNNGMELAEIDLRFRGPGQRFGQSQHGRWDLKIADFSDLVLINKAKKAALNPLLQERLLKSKIRLLI
ncbi:ATP-dependent DNA helicase RecG [Candidatus Microgenomates bacterium]|nr:ATP-dependent DNA helicase RecG [Candidatus Microgenomates bacterium]